MISFFDDAVRRRPWLPAAVLAFAALLAFANSFSVPLLFDDNLSITQNASIRDLRDLGAVLAPASDVPTAGRPLLNLSFALNYAAGGLRVWGYHAVNLALHWAAALTLFGLLRRTLDVRGERGAQRSAAIALTAALLWLVHPLQTATITYISQRAEAMMALCYLATLYFFARAAARPHVKAWEWASVAACALGMLCKETMATAPLLVLLFDRAFFAGSFRAAWRRRTRYYVALAATWLILAALMVQTRVGARGVGFGGDIGPWTYALTETRVILGYLKLALWPQPLVFDYGPEIAAHSLGDVWSPALALAALLVGTALLAWRRPRVGFLAAAFFIVLAPTSSVVPVIFQPMAENRLYLPVAAIMSAMAIGLEATLTRRIGAVAAPVLVAAAFGLVCARRNVDYRSAIAIWADTVAKRPGNVRAHSFLGEALLAAGKADAATREFNAALALEPGHGPAHNNLGVIAVQQGRLADAVRHYEAALRAMPTTAAIHNNLAGTLQRLPGREPDAIAHYREAIRLSPALLDPHRNLAALLLRRGDAAGAFAEYNAALQIAPANAQVHADAALALLTVGQVDDAVQQCQAALQLDPRNVAAHLYLGHALQRLRRSPEAVAQYRAATELEPGAVEAWANLGFLLVQDPAQRDAGVAALREALRLRPDFTAAREALERLQKDE